MDREALNRLRREVLSEVKGEVLEIGFGTGVNLAFYPPGVRKLTTADPNPGMRARAQKRIQASPRFVDTWMVTAETLPMPDNTFDTVVSTMTLCSVSDADAAIREVYRVLKPGGRLLFFRAWTEPGPCRQILAGRTHPRNQNSRRRMPPESKHATAPGEPTVRHPKP